MKNDEKVTDEELAEYLATHDREGLTLDELSDHDCASIRLAPRLARALAALRAPVDVEGEMGHIANAITRAVVETAFLNEEGEVVIRLNTLAAAAVVRSHVERAAQLAREAAELRADLLAVERTIPEAYRYSKPHLSIAAILDELNGVTADLTAARAEIERLKVGVRR
jgi:hypothetical protein